MEPISLYVHIPYCIQRCRYCDFTTFEQNSIMAPKNYYKLLMQELQNRAQLIPHKKIQTVYFGGGTPSLFPAELIVSFLESLSKHGFTFTADSEITIEINPATIDQEKIKLYKSAGINRFSVGAQSFQERLLKICGREHSVKDTLKTLELLQQESINYSFDLLFALPTQTLKELEDDLAQLHQIKPPHVSAYCLTVPEGHPMSFNRPKDADQIAMFKMIEASLADLKIVPYEISNFAQKGYESKHNMAYWTDQNFWGLGLSAHSYIKDFSPYGTRFWNPKDFTVYENQTLKNSESIVSLLPSNQSESLKPWEALTDFCYTRLRLAQGLDLGAVQNKFGSRARSLVEERAQSEQIAPFLYKNVDSYALNFEGKMLSNKVFAEFLFDQEAGLTEGQSDS